MNERENRLSWSDLFIGVAKLAAQRSPDPHTQVGAVIVKDNRILSIGYNGTPSTFKYNFDWKTADKYLFCVHAEANALSNAAQVGACVNGADIYITLSPCTDCLKLLIQAGIKNIYYIDEYKDIELSKLIVNNVGDINLVKINEGKQ